MSKALVTSIQTYGSIKANLLPTCAVTGMAVIGACEAIGGPEVGVLTGGAVTGYWQSNDERKRLL